MAPILQTFQNFSAGKLSYFHWNLLLEVQLTISQHWFICWWGDEQLTSHHLKQWWPCLQMHFCISQRWPVNTLRRRQNGRHFAQDWHFNTLRPRQNGRHFPDDIFRYIFLNENVWIPIEISLKFVPKGPINIVQIIALVQIMAWRRPGDKPLSEPMLVSLPTHLCVTRPQWVKG